MLAIATLAVDAHDCNIPVQGKKNSVKFVSTLLHTSSSFEQDYFIIYYDCHCSAESIGKDKLPFNVKSRLESISGPLCTTVQPCYVFVPPLNIID